MKNEIRKKQPPLLLTSHGAEYEKHFFYSLSENRYQTTSIPILRDKYIFASTYGWLVLVDYTSDDCCLWNPVSMETIQLPSLDESHLYNMCILSKPPTEPDCYILFNCISDQSFCKIGDDEFVKHSLEEEDEYHLLAIASFQGKIYGIMKPSYNFVTIHLVGKTLELMPILMEDGGQPWKVPLPDRSWFTWHEDCLIECGTTGELLSVVKMYSGSYLKDGVEFRVFRVDINGMECVEVDNIGDQTIFISYRGTGFCSDFSGTKPNSIYYTDKKGRDVYIYDLDDGSTTPWLPCPAAGRYVSVNYWVDLHHIFDQPSN